MKHVDKKKLTGGSSVGSDMLFAELIVQHATDSMVFTDADGLVVWANRPFEAMSGYSLPEMIGKKPGSVLQGQDTDSGTVAEISAAIKDRRTIRTELLNYTKKGFPYWIDLTITPVFNDKGTLTHFMSIERDITDAKGLVQQTQEALRQETERKRERRLLAQMSEWLFSAQSLEELQNVVERAMSRLFPNTNGVLYIYSNSRDVLDRTVDWGDGDFAKHLHPDQCWALRRGRAYSFGASEIDFACEHVEDERHPYFCLPIIAHGDTIGLLHIVFPELEAVRDKAECLAEQLGPTFEMAQICAEQISLAAANVRLQIQLQDQSVKDPLTGLWNRRWFLDMAAREIRRTNAAKREFSLAMLDIDHFKRFNDAHGHDAGDIVLKTFAEHLAAIKRDGVYPCRIGGEEFSIIFSGHNVNSALAVLEALRESVSSGQITYAGTALPGVTFSAGVAAILSDEPLETLIKRADELLYAAKEAGRDRLFGSDSHSKD